MAALLRPSKPGHVVAIVGGAVAGSEAAALCAERGVTALVLEQRDRPFGKIEDGLPRWHEKLRAQEYEQITENLTRPGVWYLPRTELGEHVSLEELVNEWGVSAVFLASGAWRDRPLFADAEQYVGAGLVYQNPLVHWYNHYPEPGYDGPSLAPPGDPIVVGGGLASIDVVKILNFEIVKRALHQRDVRVTTLDIEHDGVPETLRRAGLSWDDLGVRGATLVYRREKTEMPLAWPPDGATDAQREKVGQVRARLMDKVIDKYHVAFQGSRALHSPLLEDGRLVGLRFQKTATVGGRLVTLDDELVTVRSGLIVSSIGSIPVPLPGLPMKGELVDFEDPESGRVRGLRNVFGLGNVLTGKGNIRESRKNAAQVSTRVLEGYLTGAASGDASLEDAHRSARENAEAPLAAAQAHPPLSGERAEEIGRRVASHWARVGYTGDFSEWIARTQRPAHEA